MVAIDTISFRQRYWMAVSVFLVMVWITLTVCPASAKDKTYSGNYPIRAGATVGMVADIVQEVAGDKARVTNTIGAGIDPHMYTEITWPNFVICSSIIMGLSLLLSLWPAIKAARFSPVEALRYV